MIPGHLLALTLEEKKLIKSETTMFGTLEELLSLISSVALESLLVFHSINMSPAIFIFNSMDTIHSFQ